MLSAKRRISREGFTLVELLIVIVVIGVLSAMMMLSSTEAVSSAKATDIINNLHQWKRAPIAWYVDNLDEVEATASEWNGVKQRWADHIHAPSIVPYINSHFKSVEDKRAWDTSNGRYFTDHISGGETNTLTNKKTNGIWLIGYEMPKDDARVKEKLEARAKTARLLWKDGNKLYQYTASGSNHHRVWVMVMDFGS